LPLPLIFILQ